jgi:hypothetical protein
MTNDKIINLMRGCETDTHSIPISREQAIQILLTMNRIEREALGQEIIGFREIQMLDVLDQVRPDMIDRLCEGVEELQ